MSRIYNVFRCLYFHFQIDLVDDIPNQEDEDMDDVTIIEPVSS